MEKEEFLSMNETERENYLIEKNNINLEKFEFTFKNSWSNFSAFRVDLTPSLFVVKQLNYKSIGIEFLGFVFTVQRNYKGKPITLNNK